MNFKIGDSVRVKKGVKIPEMDCDLSFWQGRISEINDNNIICIDLDSKTLNSLPAEDIKKCEREGYAWHNIYLGNDDIEIVPPRDTQNEVKETLNRLFNEFAWAHLGEQGDRINAILSNLTPDVDLKAFERWLNYLSSNLTLPCEAEVIEIQEQGPLQCDDKVIIRSLDTHEYYGVMADVETNRKRFWFPLSDLEAVNKASANYELIYDYVIWYANR